MDWNVRIGTKGLELATKGGSSFKFLRTPNIFARLFILTAVLAVILWFVRKMVIK